jgi:hypothetical protein
MAAPLPQRRARGLRTLIIPSAGFDRPIRFDHATAMSGAGAVQIQGRAAMGGQHFAARADGRRVGPSGRL